MTLRARVFATVAVLGLLGAAAAGIAVGIQLGDRASEQGTTTLSLRDPAFEQLLAEPALRSNGGFTGFGGLPALDGRVLRYGRLTDLKLDPPTDDGTIGGTATIEADGTTTAVRFVRVERFFAIAPAEEDLHPGDLVQLRIEGSQAVATLRLPPDLEEGAGVVSPSGP